MSINDQIDDKDQEKDCCDVTIIHDETVVKIKGVQLVMLWKYIGIEHKEKIANKI